MKRNSKFSRIVLVLACLAGGYTLTGYAGAACDYSKNSSVTVQNKLGFGQTIISNVEVTYHRAGVAYTVDVTSEGSSTICMTKKSEISYQTKIGNYSGNMNIPDSNTITCKVFQHGWQLKTGIKCS